MIWKINSGVLEENMKEEREQTTLHKLNKNSDQNDPPRAKQND